MNLAMVSTASLSMPRNPCCALASHGADWGGSPPSSNTTSTVRALVRRRRSFLASAAGVMSQPSSRCDEIAGQSIAPEATSAEPITARIDDFIPTVDRYFLRIAIAAQHVLRGERYVAV